MELTRYVDTLRRALAVAAESGGDDALALADRLTPPLDAAVRLMLLDALSTAADEITLELAPGSVELRLRAGAPTFVVTRPPIDDAARPPAGAAPAPGPPDGDDGATARINLRLPEHLKAGAEAAASGERLSLNAWLVRTVAASLADGVRDRPPRRGGRGGQSFTGWVS